MEERNTQPAALDPTNTSYPLDPIQLVQQLVQDGETVYGDQWEAIDEDLAFALDLEHYNSDTGMQQRAEWLIQPTTLELFNVIRHKVAEICRQETNVDCRPVDQYGDPETAEWTKWAIEHEIYNPRKRYKQRRRTMVLGGVVARVWGMRIDFDQHCGPWGEIIFANVDPTNVIVPEGITDIHDPRCAWLIDLEDWRVQDVWAMEGPIEQGGGGWQNTALVRGTTSRDTTTRRQGMFSDGRVNLRGRKGEPNPSEQRITKIAKLWLRYDESAETRNDYLELPPEEQYFQCDQCQQDLEPSQVQIGRDEQGTAFPYCPDCGMPVEPVDTVQESNAYQTYPNGRLIIVALDEKGEGDNVNGVLLYDGKWPFAYRSFPYWFFRPYDHPRKWITQSDTSLNWTLQVMSNAVLRLGYEQMIRTTDIIMTPAGGLQNSKGEPFEFTDAPGQIAYFRDPLAANLTKHFQGTGLPPAWATLESAIENKFRANVGTSDIGAAPERTKDIPVGTIQTMVAQGEVPVEDHISVLIEDEGIFLGCIVDAIIGGAWPAEKWVRTVGPQGIYVMQQMSAADLPQVDVFVTGTPRMFNIHAQEFQLFMQWLSLGADPAAQMIAAQTLNISPSLIQKYMMMRQRMMLSGEAQALSQGAPPPNGMPGGAPGAPQGGSPIPGAGPARAGVGVGGGGMQGGR